MIKYHKTLRDQNLESLVISGHALFADFGNDIVCAAVSTAVIMTINAIESLGEKENIKVIIEEGYVEINVLKSTKIVDGLLNNLTYSLNDLNLQFPKNIKEE